MIGGIDLGGTKIEARAFDDGMREVARHRISTPVESYDALLDGLLNQIQWLESQGNMEAIGLGTPGLIAPATGIMLTANLPASGHTLGRDLSQRAHRKIHLINDCRAATFSEAIAGAGKGFENVAGLTIGTGVAGGQVIKGQIVPDLNGQHGEYGHLPLPAVLVARHDLSLHRCGCGLTGCFETYLAGPGITRLAKEKTGNAAPPERIMSEPDFLEIKSIWLDIATSLIGILARTIDPEVIVLSGGLGTAENLPQDLTEALDGKLLAGTSIPKIVQAEHGDASGALGAALFARAAVSV